MDERTARRKARGAAGAASAPGAASVAESKAAEATGADAKPEPDEGPTKDYPYHITYHDLNIFFFIKSLFNLGDYEYKTLKVKELIKIMLSIYINVDPFKTIQEHIDSPAVNRKISSLNDTEHSKDHDYSLDTYKSIYGLIRDD